MFVVTKEKMHILDRAKLLPYNKSGYVLTVTTGLDFPWDANIQLKYQNVCFSFVQYNKLLRPWVNIF